MAEMTISTNEGNRVVLTVTAFDEKVRERAKEIVYGPRFEKWGHIRHEQPHKSVIRFTIDDADPVKMQNYVDPKDDAIALFNETGANSVSVAWMPYVDAFNRGFRYTRSLEYDNFTGSDKVIETTDGVGFKGSAYAG